MPIELSRFKSSGRPRKAAAKSALSPEELNQKIAEKAYELYQQRGCTPGSSASDWLEAEKLVRAQYGKGTPSS